MHARSGDQVQNAFRSQTGAEARIEIVRWHGLPAISKVRLRKDYRREELDSRLKSRRTKEEARILYEAKRAGVDSPSVYLVDPGKAEIVMEYIDGATLKDLARDSGAKKLPKIRSLRKMFFRLGQLTQALHSKNIIHGDLTTMNILLSKELKRMVMIDFGLSFTSERLEDKAEDLHLMKQALASSLDSGSARAMFAEFLKGYSWSSTVHARDMIKDQISEIERRGRYAIVD